jgi:hypothetical protein
MSIGFDISKETVDAAFFNGKTMEHLSNGVRNLDITKSISPQIIPDNSHSDILFAAFRKGYKKIFPPVSPDFSVATLLRNDNILLSNRESS